MNGNNKILKELVKYVREQRQANLRQEKINLDQKKMNINFEKRLQFAYNLVSDQKEELKILRQWLANHEVRLRGLEA